jgi:hypothetical protein
MKNYKSLMQFGLVSALLLGVSCSHISTERAPSSVKTSFGKCKMTPDQSGKQYHLYVDEKLYPSHKTYSAFEAEQLMTRFKQTGTCEF